VRNLLFKPRSRKPPTQRYRHALYPLTPVCNATVPIVQTLKPTLANPTAPINSPNCAGRKNRATDFGKYV
jgi:hypothetical protein